MSLLSNDSNQTLEEIYEILESESPKYIYFTQIVQSLLSIDKLDTNPSQKAMILTVCKRYLKVLYYIRSDLDWAFELFETASKHDEEFLKAFIENAIDVFTENPYMHHSNMELLLDKLEKTIKFVVKAVCHQEYSHEIDLESPKPEFAELIISRIEQIKLSKPPENSAQDRLDILVSFVFRLIKYFESDLVCPQRILKYIQSTVKNIFNDSSQPYSDQITPNTDKSNVFSIFLNHKRRQEIERQGNLELPIKVCFEHKHIKKTVVFKKNSAIRIIQRGNLINRPCLSRGILKPSQDIYTLRSDIFESFEDYEEAFKEEVSVSSCNLSTE